MNQPIYHVAGTDDAAASLEQRSYHTASLDTEGFIHCCTAEQLPGVFQRYYGDAEQVVLMSINRDALTSNLVMENTVGGTELFPHIYGAINADAIIDQKQLDRAGIDAIAEADIFSANLLTTN